MYWFLKCLKQYADFKGRARRKEYWMFYLYTFLISIIILVIAAIINQSFIMIIYLLLLAFLLIPTISVTVRRLHDVGHSGWMYFLVFIPLIGGIWLLIQLVKEGDKGETGYGPDPKEEIAMSIEMNY